MAGTLERSLNDLFSEDGPFGDGAEEKDLSRVAPGANAEPAGDPADWMEPDAISLSPDDPEPLPTAAGGTAAASATHGDPSEVVLDPAEGPPLELDEPRSGAVSASESGS
jgi:hypothetical protein